MVNNTTSLISYDISWWVVRDAYKGTMLGYYLCLLEHLYERLSLCPLLILKGSKASDCSSNFTKNLFWQRCYCCGLLDVVVKRCEVVSTVYACVFRQLRLRKDPGSNTRSLLWIFIYSFWPQSCFERHVIPLVSKKVDERIF